MTFRIFSGKKKKFMHKAKAVNMQQVLMQACSFKSFCNYHDVFDMNKGTIISNKNNLFNLYAHGIGIDSPVLIINKN